MLLLSRCMIVPLLYMGRELDFVIFKTPPKAGLLCKNEKTRCLMSDLIFWSSSSLSLCSDHPPSSGPPTSQSLHSSPRLVMWPFSIPFFTLLTFPTLKPTLIMLSSHMLSLPLMMFCILTFCPWHFSLPNLVDSSHILYRDHLVSRLWKVSSMKARILVSFYTYVTQLGLTQLGLPRWLSGKESTRQCRCGFNPWVGKIPWRRKWQSTPVFLPGKSYGQRSLVGYSPWGHKESDPT